MELERLKKCELLSHNQLVMENVFKGKDVELSSLCAANCAIKNVRANALKMNSINSYIKTSSFVKGEFLPGSRLVLATVLQDNEDYKKTVNDVVEVDKKLLRRSLPSHHLSLAAELIVEMIKDSDQYEIIVQKTDECYQLLQSNYAFMVSQIDCCNAALFAIQKKDYRELVQEQYACLKILKQNNFFIKNLISLAASMAVVNQDANEKIDCFHKFADHLERSGVNIAYENYDLAIIGTLALASEDYEASINNIKDIDQYLVTQLQVHRVLQKKLRSTRRMYYAMAIEASCCLAKIADSERHYELKMALTNALMVAILNDVTVYLGGLD